MQFTIDPIARLRAHAEESSARQLAWQIGVSAAYLGEVLAKAKPPGPKILKWLGLERVEKVTYREVAARRRRAKRKGEPPGLGGRTGLHSTGAKSSKGGRSPETQE